MITADRFLAAKHTNEARWLRVRRLGVTATAVAEVAGTRDRAAAIREWLNPEPFDGNAYTQFGTESEDDIMRHAHQWHGILPVDWVIAAETNRRHMASPDGLSPDHTVIAECKTTGDGWDGAETNASKLPFRYRRQVQFQLYVTGAERCLFAWQLRVPDGGWFRFGWFEPRTIWIDRDEKMIAHLIEVADEMLEVRDGATVQRAA